MDNTNKFLYSIGFTKKFKENFLSDIVRAKCLYDDKFLNLFFRHCFSDATEDIKVYSMDRETACDSYIEENLLPKAQKKQLGRNDFKIYTNRGIYIVESKILDSDVSKCEKYLDYLENVYKTDSNYKVISKHITYIISKQNGNATQIERMLKTYGISFCHWEDFIEGLSENDQDDFSTLAKSILNKENCIQEKAKIETEELKKRKELCDRFFTENLDSKQYDKKGGKESEWNDENGYSYGYTIWASVWFGLLWSELKGAFWAFGYSKGGKKDIDNTKYEFNYIKPLGKYLNDGFTYYEIINPHESNGDGINEEVLLYAYKEFAKIINVHDGSGIKPLDEYIESQKE